MGDDKKKKAADSKLVSAGETYELRYFARKHGLSLTDAEKVIKKAGPSREKANKLAEAIKKS